MKASALDNLLFKVKKIKITKGARSVIHKEQKPSNKTLRWIWAKPC